MNSAPFYENPTRTINFAPFMKTLFPEEEDAQNDFKEYLQEDAVSYGKRRIAGEVYYDYADMMAEECGNVKELYKRMYSIFKGEKDEQHSFVDWLNHFVIDQEEVPPPYTEQE